VGLGAKDVDALYVSHLHADHIGGIEWLGFSRYFGKGPKPDLYVNERLSHSLWENSLRGGWPATRAWSSRSTTSSPPSTASTRTARSTGGQTYCQLVQTVHYMDGYEIVPSYGLLMRVENNPAAGEVFLTTDTQFAPSQIMDFYRRASVIFQDCETAPYRSGVHAHYAELVTLPPDVRAKMWLYHYQDGPLPDAKADGFAGFVERGQTFEF
jgi:ribonuclease BN (tRNA processing enzyme)